MEDGLSLTFDSAPLEEAVEILGYPEVTLTVAADRPNALVVVRLCDVAPTGSSLLVSCGFLNLTHRASHEKPTPLEPGRRYTVTVRLDAIGHRLPAGHRWRVAVSPTYWPQAWPSPEPVTLSVFTGEGSQLKLPVRSPRVEDASLAPFGPPETSAPLVSELLRPSFRNRVIHRDIGNHRLQIEDVFDDGHRRLVHSGLEFYGHGRDVYTISEDDPLSASIRCEQTMGLKRGAWQVQVETSSTMSADAETFYVTNTIEAYEGNTRVFTKPRDFKVPRHGI
jgi:hypothetical protein